LLPLLLLLLLPLPLFPLPLPLPLLLAPLPLLLLPDELLPPPPPARPNNEAALDDDINDAAELCAPRIPPAPLSALGGAGTGIKATASSIAGQYTRIAVMRFSVNVPVLSVQM
jgi:hypothetical protein